MSLAGKVLSICWLAVLMGCSDSGGNQPDAGPLDDGQVDAGGDPGGDVGDGSAHDADDGPDCVDPIALAATVTPLNDPVDCAPGYACSVQDFQIDFETCQGPVPGLRFRLIRPDEPRDPTSLYLDFPGTGACYTALASVPGVLMGYADLGVAVAGLSIRGHAKCYLEGDDLYRMSTWAGPDEMQDYDRLVWAFLNGEIPGLPRADPAGLGFGGVSHGGITSFIYGRQSQIPAVTGQPFALAIPSGGVPSSLDWFTFGMDPRQVETLEVSAWGSVRLSGWPGQLFHYAGEYTEHLAALVEAGDLSEFSNLVEGGMFRSGFDPDDATASYRANVQASLITMASQDCIIPKSGAFLFFQSLLQAGGRQDRLISPLGYHTCSGSDQGYQPYYTSEVKTRVNAWKNEVRSRAVRRFLLKDQSVDLDAWPPWMFMLADEGDQPGEIPTVYGALDPGGLPTSDRTWYLDPQQVLTGSPPPEASLQLTHDPGNCLAIDLANPCAATSNLEYLLFDSPPLQQDLLVVGKPRLTIHASEASGADYAFTAILAEVPDPSAPGVYWPVTSERRFATQDTSQVRTHPIELDWVVHRFSAGSSVRLVLTNLSLPVTGCLMFAPSTNPYQLTFLTSHQEVPARLDLPVITQNLQPAPDAWQLD